MKIITAAPNPSGAYPPIQSVGFPSVPEGTALWPEELDTGDFYAYNGFVTLTIEAVGGVDTVTAVAPNVEAWEAWKASLPPDPGPEPEQPTVEERVATLEEEKADKAELDQLSAAIERGLSL